MRKIVALSIALFALPALAAPIPLSVWSESQILTRADPTTSATDGVALGNVSAFVVVLEAEATRTLSGAGSLKAWFYDSTIGAWYPGEPADDLTVHSNCTGKRRCKVGLFTVPGPRGRVLFAASGVTVSGGTTVTVRLLPVTGSW